MISFNQITNVYIKKTSADVFFYFIKWTALDFSMLFWDHILEELGREYSEVKTYSYLVDAASMFMIKDPRCFEVVVISNLLDVIK